MVFKNVYEEGACYKDDVLSLYDIAFPEEEKKPVGYIEKLVSENKMSVYAILEEDSLTKRNERMESAIYEFIAVSQVSNEAQSQQNEENEKAYREQAIKKQISILQADVPFKVPAESPSDFSIYLYILLLFFIFYNRIPYSPNPT